MKKFKTILFSGLLCFAFYSCQDRSNIETPAMRSYQQDVAVLNEFVDIYSTMSEFYINPNKKTTALSYIVNTKAEELNLVSPLNLDQFNASVARINGLARQAMTYQGVDYMVMATNHDIYIRKIKSNSPVALKKITSGEYSNGNIYASVQVTDVAQSHYARGRILETSIDLNPLSYKNAGWYFYVNCQVGNRNKETVRVLFCGVGYNYHLRFGWELDPSYEAQTEWKFTVTGGFNNNRPDMAAFNFLY